MGELRLEECSSGCGGMNGVTGSEFDMVDFDDISWSTSTSTSSVGKEIYRDQHMD